MTGGKPPHELLNRSPCILVSSHRPCAPHRLRHGFHQKICLGFYHPLDLITLLRLAALIYNKRCSEYQSGMKALSRSADSFRLLIVVIGSRALKKHEPIGCGCGGVAGGAGLCGASGLKARYGFAGHDFCNSK